MKTPIEILLVDDESSHRIISKRALRRSFPQAHVHECASLVEADPLIANSKITLTLAIIDLNLEGKSGLEVVRVLRAESRYRSLPIIVNSTSQLESDVEQSYAGGASIFIFKSDQPEVFNAELSAAALFLLR